MSRDRWREIVRFKHPALAGRHGEVRGCLERPKMIRQSATNPGVHLYYAPSGPVHLCVVVTQGGKEDGFVITAYLTRNIKQGAELWRS